MKKIEKLELDLDDLQMSDIDKARHDAKIAHQNESADSLLGLYFPVLDHGFISLVDYMGDDAAIARAARCSYGAGTKAVSNDRNLIRYLLRHRHTSPIEQVELKFHAKMPIFVARQWVRHRTANLNEMSGRYSIMPLQFYTPARNDFQVQSKDNKQGRGDITDAEVYDSFVQSSEQLRSEVEAHYTESLSHDVAREIARIDLPLSTYTEWYWKIDLHNLLHFLRLRCDSHAQYEIRAYANVMAGMAKMVAPAAFEAWEDYSLGSVAFSKNESKLLKMAMSGKVPTEEDAKSIGLSKREWAEYQNKVNSESETPSFDLDLSTAKPPEYFREQSEMYVPDPDNPKAIWGQQQLYSLLGEKVALTRALSDTPAEYGIDRKSVMGRLKHIEEKLSVLDTLPVPSKDKNEKLG